MKITGREDVNRPHGSVRRAEQNRTRPPVSVVVGVMSLVAGTAWLEALEPVIQPSLTVEFQSLGWLLFGAAVTVGTLLGVRILWVLTFVFTVPGCALVLSEAVQNPSAQSIGGLLLLTVALVCLLLPSTQQFEHRRVRLVLV